MNKFDTITESVKINRNYSLRVLKHLALLVLLWSPIIYGVYNGFKFITFTYITCAILILLLVLLIYQQRYCLKKIEINGNIVKVVYYRYSEKKIEQFSIFNLELDYSESGVYIPQGKLIIRNKEFIICKQYSCLSWDNKELRACSEKFKIQRDYTRFNEVNIRLKTK